MSAELTSWNDGATKSAIINFVRVSDESGSDYVEPAARVAIFDNDGTLWCEKPMPIQLDFTVRRLAELAHGDPSLRRRQPYQAAAENDLRWLGAAMVKHYHGDDSDLKLLMDEVTAAFDTASVGDYDAEVKAFFDAASHPTQVALPGVHSSLLRTSESSGGRCGCELQPAPAAVPGAAQGNQGRLLPVRGQLLFALPAVGA